MLPEAYEEEGSSEPVLEPAEGASAVIQAGYGRPHCFIAAARAAIKQLECTLSEKRPEQGPGKAERPGIEAFFKTELQLSLQVSSLAAKEVDRCSPKHLEPRT